MRIAVLHGSPKGEKSVTAQSVRFLEKLHPQHQFEFLTVAHDVKALEKKPEAFQAVIDAVRKADAVLWSFPVYYMLVPGQYKRFIELVDERRAREAFSGKYATALTTSAHFYDHMAQRYVHAISEDWGMKYVPGFSAGMEDLANPAEQENLCGFMRSFADTVEQGRPVPRRFPPLSDVSSLAGPLEVKEVAKTVPGRVALLYDASPQAPGLQAMIQAFVAACPCPVEVIHLHEIDLRHGCMGCCRCCLTGHCVSKDEMETIWSERVYKADAVVFAGTVVQRHFSARWKQAVDRQFFNGHRPRLNLKATGFLVSGPLRQLPELREWCEATAEVGLRTATCPVVSDEDAPEVVAAHVAELARQVGEGTQAPVRRPATFLGVGGHLIFRDLIYASSAFLRADYAFYKREGLLDYPQGNYAKRALNAALSVVLAIPPLRRAFEQNLESGMMAAQQKAVEKAVPPHP